MWYVLIISIVIVFAVLALAIVTTNKAYAYKHTIDPLDYHPETENAGECISDLKKKV